MRKRSQKENIRKKINIKVLHKICLIRKRRPLGSLHHTGAVRQHNVRVARFTAHMVKLY